MVTLRVIVLATLLSLVTFAATPCMAATPTSSVNLLSPPLTDSAPVLPAPHPVMLMRDYVFPSIVTAAALLRRLPTYITYDEFQYIWATDTTNDLIWRLTPASGLNATLTTASEWRLPSTGAKWNPAHIITDTPNTCAYFTNTGRRSISELNWTSNQLRDWPLGQYGLKPFDLVMDQYGVIWFTNVSSNVFGSLNPATNALSLYWLQLAGAPPGVVEITSNGTNLYMTDGNLNYLYEFRAATFPGSGVLAYRLGPGAGALGVECDPANNLWVTQPSLELVGEQKAGSTAKELLTVLDLSPPVIPLGQVLPHSTIDVRIQLYPLVASIANTTPTVVADPLLLFPVPTAISWPCSISTGIEAYAWYTEPASNQIGAIDPTWNVTYEYTLPTSDALPYQITVVPSLIIQPDHVWFTEVAVGKIGEIFEASFVNIRVCPSLPPQYPPPSPGSIRWTWEPGAEIWIDAPSNGFNPVHHDPPERFVTNHLYARVRNMGTDTASGVSVKFYYHNMSLGFAEFIPLPPLAPSPTYWTLIGSVTIPSLAAGAETDVYVDWTIDGSVPVHQCIGVQVGGTSDISLYDNVAYRNFVIAGIAGGAPALLSLPIWITNPYDRKANASVSISGLPPGWTASIDPNNFQLGGGESRQLMFHVRTPQGVPNGTQAIFKLTGTVNQEVTGYVWVQINVLGASRITCNANPASVFVGDIVTISGAITPARTGVVVTVRITLPSGSWYELYPWTDGTGKYSTGTLPNGEVGTYQVTASWSGDGTLTGASANTAYSASPYIPVQLLLGFAVGFAPMLVILLVTLMRRKPATIPPRRR